MSESKESLRKDKAFISRMVFAAIVVLELIVAEQIVIHMVDSIASLTNGITQFYYLSLALMVLIFLYFVGDKARAILIP